MEPIVPRPLTQPSSHFLISTQERLQVRGPSVTLNDTLKAFVANLREHYIDGAQKHQS